MPRALLRLLVVTVALLLASGPASAHVLGLSRGVWQARGGQVDATLTFARSELLVALPALDANHDGHLGALELAEGRARLAELVVARTRVTVGDVVCPGRIVDQGLTEEDGALVHARFACPDGEGAVAVTAGFLDGLASGHRHVAELAVAGGEEGPRLLVGEERTLLLRRDPVAPASAPSAPVVATSAAEGGGIAETGPSATLWGFFRMGLEHILRGVDHLCFLLGLVLVPTRRRALLATVTAFTLAHSLSLALAVLDVWAPSPRFVEPAIALSIVWVGIEVARGRDAGRRWRIALLFGLVHGFGFAGALRAISLAPGRVPAALVPFNFGVEAGQLLVLACLVPALAALNRRPGFDRGVPLAGVALAVAGGVWFVVRTLG